MSSLIEIFYGLTDVCAFQWGFLFVISLFNYIKVKEREQVILSTIPQLYKKVSVLEHQMTS